MTKRISLEITINVVVEATSEGLGAAEVVDWQFDATPRRDFDRLPPLVRAAIWSKLRDEIEEFWLSTALQSSPDAAWNWLLEDVDLD